MLCSSLLTAVFWATTENVYAPAVTGYVTTPFVVLAPHGWELPSPSWHVKSAGSLAV